MHPTPSPTSDATPGAQPAATPIATTQPSSGALLPPRSPVVIVPSPPPNATQGAK
eukprot:IDg21373t1